MEKHNAIDLLKSVGITRVERFSTREFNVSHLGKLTKAKLSEYVFLQSRFEFRLTFSKLENQDFDLEFRLHILNNQGTIFDWTIDETKLLPLLTLMGMTRFQ